MSARERRDERRAALLDRAGELDAKGVTVTLPGTKAVLETLPLGTHFKISSGVEMRLEHLGLGSATVTVLNPNTNDGWRKGDRQIIAPRCEVEVI